MKAFLHIGTEKTGTTTIQHFFARNRSNLLEDGFLYPCSPGEANPIIGETNHIKLAAFAMEENKIQNPRNLLGITDSEKVLKFRNEFKNNLAQELDKTQAKSVIFSNEHCSSRLVTKEEIERLKNFLEDFFEEIKIIIYLRRQDKFLLSTYSTAVLGGRTEPFCMPGQTAIERRYDYWKILSKWEAVFGKDKIVVRVFEREQMLGGDLLKDFSNLLNINITERYESIKTLNQSLDVCSLEFLRTINPYLPKFQENKINKSRLDIVNSIATYSKYHSNEKNISMPREMIEEFMLNFEESNRKVATYFLNRPDGKLFLNDFRSEQSSSPKKLTIKKSLEIGKYILKEKIKKTLRVSTLTK
jgi:hypothetical protein